MNKYLAREFVLWAVTGTVCYLGVGTAIIINGLLMVALFTPITG